MSPYASAYICLNLRLAERSETYLVMEKISIMPTEVVEYLFCPRFTYFMNCLCIPQHEEQRYKVLKGREIHKIKQEINKEYLRKRLHCTGKDTLVYLSSGKYRLRGVVDEVLFLEDGTLAPLDYKFAEYKEKLFNTYRYQSILYALLIKENYDKEVNRGYICYTRSKNLIREIRFSDKDFKMGVKLVDEILEIIDKGYYPKKTRYLTKCIDCCYRNICV